MTTNMYILSGIVTAFILLGTALPFIQAEFSIPQTNFNTQGLEFDTGQETSEANLSDTTVTGVSIIVSIFLMFFWTFGALPLWLDTFLLILRIFLVIGVYNLIRGND